MRSGERVYLKTEDVGLEKRTITIQPSAANKFSAKSGKFRIVGINTNLVGLLQLFLERKARYFFGSEDEPLLLPNGHSVAFLTLQTKAKLPRGNKLALAPAHLYNAFARGRDTYSAGPVSGRSR